ncbi:MAG: cell wall hydrolase [Pseudomonadota bacterium]
MTRPVLGSIAAILTAGFINSAALAEVTISTSTNASAEIGGRFSALLSAEGDTVRGMDKRAMKRLIEAPAEADNGPYSRKALDALKPVKGGKEWACLTEAIYFEARGETVRGMFGVAEVILNRVDDPRYPQSICKVVNQGTGERYRCQFTYTCDGRPENMSDKRAYQRVGKVAHMMISGMDRRLTNGATHYHTKSVKPRWSKVFPRTATIGYHHFYKEPSRVASR